MRWFCNSVRLPTQFVRDARGGVAAIFSMSLLVLGMAAGLAIDYARSISTWTALQDDIDATLLVVGRGKLLAGEGAYDVQRVAESYLKGMHRQKHGSSAGIKLTVTQTAPGHLKATAVTSVPTTFSKLFGQSSFTIDVHSEVALGDQPVEVALVLDNTGSMAGSKLDALKDAARSLIETAYLAERSEQNVKIGLVPFAQYVNVGQTHRNASWMSVPLDSVVTQPEVCYEETPVIGQSNCRTETRTGMSDGTPYSYSVEVCDYQYGPPAQRCYTPTVTSNWYGCAGSRNYPLETLDENYDTPIPGVMNASCPSQIAPLTNDKAALGAQVDAMVATGETYIPAGLIWGWRLLSKIAPYEDAKGYDEHVNGQTVRKILVLMSDGKNTLSPLYPEHTGTDTAVSDTLTREICQHVKAKGITIYTVAFDVPDNDAKQVLQDCASGEGNFYDTDDGHELDEAFRKIAQDFSPLRLTR